VILPDQRGAVVRAGETAPVLYPTNGGFVEAEWTITDAACQSTSLVVGRAVYSGGEAQERGEIGWHRHPNAEEVVIVLSGRAEHLLEGESFVLAPGDVCLIPRGVAHAMRNGSRAELVIWWAYGGVASLDAAGYQAVDLAMPPRL
jgi:mannose-6-phosphate isomerase-like protein (cupin superfamily)